MVRRLGDLPSVYLPGVAEHRWRHRRHSRHGRPGVELDRLCEYGLGLLANRLFLWRGGGVGGGANRFVARIAFVVCMPAAIAREDGHLFSCTVHDF